MLSLYPDLCVQLVQEDWVHTNRMFDRKAIKHEEMVRSRHIAFACGVRSAGGSTVHEACPRKTASAVHGAKG